MILTQPWASILKCFFALQIFRIIQFQMVDLRCWWSSVGLRRRPSVYMWKFVRQFNVLHTSPMSQSRYPLVSTCTGTKQFRCHKQRQPQHAHSHTTFIDETQMMQATAIKCMAWPYQNRTPCAKWHTWKLCGIFALNLSRFPFFQHSLQFHLHVELVYVTLSNVHFGSHFKHRRHPNTFTIFITYE